MNQFTIRAVLSSAIAPPLDPNTISLCLLQEAAYLQDVEELPEQATLADYNRVLVEQFVTTILHGITWEEGGAARRKGCGRSELWMLAPRPALLYLGAEKQEVLDSGYTPIVYRGDYGTIDELKNFSHARKSHSHELTQIGLSMGIGIRSMTRGGMRVGIVGIDARAISTDKTMTVVKTSGTATTMVSTSSTSQQRESNRDHSPKREKRQRWITSRITTLHRNFLYV